ncbi:haloacid dehalogenase [Aerococcus urinaehominis]|uniref:Haloacid dehalogenase n=1 Tax=Aerococcus urinaehominis TaxID=128944 RepID=A0A0X8FM38_9LACT|nr:Cof-type HAD-IIB family hydrolase [Aerococcus urinaehominis]AMB99800.1 haloacid dehalogenase [Aerococcus urinaehominis]SDM08555.1 hypothetical protein SAMN04487985_1056 [Aerococcus urinaehominis]
MLEFIASDMDGTLLDQTLEIPQENIDAIKETYSLGIPFVVCTGRNFKEAKIPLDNAGIRCPIIGLNGAIQFDRDGQVEFEIALDDDQAKRILAMGYDRGFYLEAMTAENVYSSSREDRIKMIATLIVAQNPELSLEEASQRATQSHEVDSIEYRDNLADLIDKEGQKIVKITFVDPAGQPALAATWNDLEASYQDIYITSSFFYNMEVSHKTATKGEAIKRYAEAHGYNLDKTMTIGDNYNDVPMLEIAGYSYAMGNAEEGVFKHAKYRTESNRHAGVAKAIERSLAMTQTREKFNQ